MPNKVSILTLFASCRDRLASLLRFNPVNFLHKVFHRISLSPKIMHTSFKDNKRTEEATIRKTMVSTWASQATSKSCAKILHSGVAVSIIGPVTCFGAVADSSIASIALHKCNTTSHPEFS